MGPGRFGFCAPGSPEPNSGRGSSGVEIGHPVALPRSPRSNAR